MKLANLLFLAMTVPALAGVQTEESMVLLPTGTYVPFVLKSTAKKGEKPNFRSQPMEVRSFELDSKLVSNQDFLRFLKSHPEWQKSKIPSLFSDNHYLGSWTSDLDFGKAQKKNKPVTDVSWFAAKAYCESLGKTLPTTDQWEYALDDRGRNRSELQKRILAWYGQPHNHALADAGTDQANGFGLHDMVGLVWEWTLDFNSFLAGDELRDGNGKDNAFFCGGGSLGKLSGDDYAAFMRYSFRASLKANYTTKNLGFRCAREKK